MQDDFSNFASLRPEWDELLRCLSKPRLRPYLEDEDGRDVPTFIRRYERNLYLGLRFMLLMHHLEVALRNEIDRALSEALGQHWFQRRGALLPPQTRQLAEAKGHLKSAAATHDNLVAALPLGFWVGLLGKKYEREQQYWRRYLHSHFRHRPEGMERAALHDRYNRLRRFRNRVAHHERILHWNPEEKLAEGLDSLEWISPQLRLWTEEMLKRLP